MSGVLVPVVFMAVLGMFLFHLARDQRHRSALEALAVRVDGLELVSDELRGTVNGVAVNVGTHTTGHGKTQRTWTQIRLQDPSSLKTRSIAAEGLFSGMHSLTASEDVQLGDPEVDPKLLLRGAESAIVAHMDHEARQHVRKAVLRGWEHEMGVWSHKQRGKATDAKALYTTMAYGIAAVHSLRPAEKDVGKQLIERTLTDPVPTAAQRALEIRLRMGPVPLDQAQRVLEAGGLLAVMMAERMGDAGLPTLRAALRDPDDELQLRAALFLANADVGPADVRAVLVGALSVDLYLPLAVEALAKVGTAQEVPALKPIAESWTHPKRLEAKQAVRSIQGRLQGAGTGQLSMAVEEGGQLSVAASAPPRQTEG